MNWIREWILVLLIPSVTGSLLMIIWMAAVHFGMGMRNTHYVYRMLRGILAGYFIPFLYLLLHWCVEYRRKEYNNFSFATPKMDQVFLVLFLIWGAGFLAVLLYRLSGWVSFQLIRRNSLAVPENYLRVLEKLYSEMNLRNPVALYQGYGVCSPFIIGVWKPVIYLPVKEFSTKELEMILYHELTHYRQGDTFWKPLFGILGNVYWFNPLSHRLWKEAVRWTEANCDFYCCKEKFKTKKYFSLLLKMGSADHNKWNSYAPMWTEDSRELEWRIQRIRKNQTDMPKPVVILVIMVLSVLCGSIATYAAAEEVQKVFNTAYLHTVEETQDERNGLPGWDAEKFNHLEIVDQPEQESTHLVKEKMDWSIQNNTTHRSAGFLVNAGEEITVSMVISSEEQKVRTGIVKPDGRISYVTGNGTLSHTFHIFQTGIYRVFVSNNSGSQVTVSGGYRTDQPVIIKKIKEGEIKQYFVASARNPIKVPIRNYNENNDTTVTFTVDTDYHDCVTSVKIYDCESCNGDHMLSATFHKTQPHKVTFYLPAQTTYYALIQPVKGESVIGNFYAEY